MPNRGHGEDTERALRGGPITSSFVGELRRALHHLYDRVELRKSPLVELFDLKQRDDPALALRGILTGAIESLKPDAGVPSKSKAWRTYHVLYSRYTEQFTQMETAAELGLGIRHLRREESLAVQALAAYLWDRYGLELKWREKVTLPTEEDALVAEAWTPSQKQELDWLQTSLPSEPVDAKEMIHGALRLVHLLAQTSEVHIDCRLPESLPHLVVQPTALRQALLNMLTAAIRCVPGGQVSIRTQVHRSEVWIYMQAKGLGATRAVCDDEIERLEMARQLVGLSEGTLEITLGEERKQSFTIKVTLPAQEQIPVLVIDDNADTLQLLQRYLSNSRYLFIGTSDPQQAVPLAIESAPKVIVVDVMLPTFDGWELLGRLHEHPQTRDIPVVVCTILPQEQLASTLGAAAFIRKPVSRQTMLTALDHQLDLWSRGSR